jgi:uncharacterized repeat protein (TIGR04138 family)
VTTEIDLKQLFHEAGGYSPAAYAFIRDGLAHTVEHVHGTSGAAEAPAEDESRHVSGQQLCLGLRDYGVKRYGLLAKAVLNRWGIHETLDFGKIIFAMIDAGLMRKTDEDTLEDFRGVYDFDEVFAEPEPTVLS